MLKNKKLWFLIVLFTILLSFNCFAADDDAEPDWEAVSVTENSDVSKKANEQMKQRAKCMEVMYADSSGVTDEVVSGTRGVGSKINTIQGRGDASRNNVNLTKAYLFADEICYPFSVFNYSSMPSNWEEKLYVWVTMDNQIKHADWQCVEKKIISYDTDCENSSPNHSCPADKPDDVFESTTYGKCNAAPWAPVINCTFGRHLITDASTSLGYSANSCTYVDQTGWFQDSGSLVYYGVYWTPKFEYDPDINDPVGIAAGTSTYHSAIGTLINNRITINKKLLTEEKQYGSS